MEAVLFFTTGSGHRVLSAKCKKSTIMLTNTPLFTYEAEILNSVKDFNSNIGQNDCSKVLETLFMDWISSESSNDTTNNYRSHVVSCYLEMQNLMSRVNVRGEVSHV